MLHEEPFGVEGSHQDHVESYLYTNGESFLKGSHNKRASTLALEVPRDPSDDRRPHR